MSAWPCEITGGPVTIQWGNLAQGGYPATYIARQVLDIPPGSLLESQIGTQNFRRIADAERGQDAHMCHSNISN